MAEFESRQAFEHIDKLAYEIGPRLAGTRGDAMAAEYISKQLKGYGLKVTAQEFSFVDRYGRAKVTACLFAVALVLALFLSPIISIIIWLVAQALWCSLSRVMPRRTSRNLIAIKEAEVPKRKIAVTAHYDSARVTVSSRFSLAVGFAFLPALVLVTVVLTINVFVAVPAWPIFWFVLAAILLPLCGAMFFGANSRRVSPGAEDNASGTAVMLEAARVLAELPPPETSLTFVAFGAEEQGLVGSRELAKSKLLPPDTQMLNLDMVGASSIPYVIEGNGMVRKVRTPASINQKLIASVVNVGLKPKMWWAPLSGHDHMPLVKAGIKATTFTFDTSGTDDLGKHLSRWFNLPNARMRGYRQLHSVDDTPERISLANIERAGAVVLDFVKAI